MYIGSVSIDINMCIYICVTFDAKVVWNNACVVEPALAGARLMLIKQFRISTRQSRVCLSTSYFCWPHVWHFELKIVMFKNTLHQSLLCDAVDCHLVKVTCTEMQSLLTSCQWLHCTAPRTSGLVMRPSAAATKVFSVPISWQLEISWYPTQKNGRIWESWVQVTRTVVDDACNMFNLNSGAFVTNLLLPYFDTPPANIPWVSPAFHSGPSRFRLKEYWIADSEFKVKHAIKTCGNSASPLDVQALLSWQGEKTRNAMIKTSYKGQEFEIKPSTKQNEQRPQCPPQTSKSRWEGCKIWQICQRNRKK